MQILKELSETGTSDTYNNIWLADYKEIPVDIDTFIESDEYLGLTNRNGAAVYPYWRKVLRDIFDAGNKYEEVFFTGATRIGKSSTAITATVYMLYKLMCLKDPQRYYNKKDVSKFSILFFNITKDLAKGVGFREFNDTLKASPWFNKHGRFSRSDQDFYYIPEGDKVVINYGSDAAHALGQQVFAGFCVVGDTPVLTDTGYVNIEELAGQRHNIGQYTSESIVYSEALVQRTKYVTETIRVELEDGTIIEGTPEHKVLLSTGEYKALGDLTSSDDLITFNTSEVDHMNLSDPDKRFSVYVHVSPTGKVYVGITSAAPEKRWGASGNGYKDNYHFWSAICKYGWDNFEHKIVAENLSLKDACDLEVELISQYDSMNPERGYNQTTGGNWSTPSQAVREKLRNCSREHWQDPEFRQKVVSGLQGHTMSAETRRKISQSKKGKKYSIVSPLKGRKLSEAHRARLKGHTSWIKGKTKDTDPRVAQISQKLTGLKRTPEQKARILQGHVRLWSSGYAPVWITDGVCEKLIDSRTAVLPEGFEFGRLNRDLVYIHKDGVSKKVPRSELNDYTADGWLSGRGDTVDTRKTQKFIWVCDDIEFTSAVQLADYLHCHGYPKIVGSTITALYNKGFSSSKQYAELAERIQRVDVCESNQ